MATPLSESLVERGTERRWRWLPFCIQGIVWMLFFPV